MTERQVKQLCWSKIRAHCLVDLLTPVAMWVAIRRTLGEGVDRDQLTLDSWVECLLLVFYKTKTKLLQILPSELFRFELFSNFIPRYSRARVEDVLVIVEVLWCGTSQFVERLLRRTQRSLRVSCRCFRFACKQSSTLAKPFAIVKRMITIMNGSNRSSFEVDRCCVRFVLEVVRALRCSQDVNFRCAPNQVWKND